MAAAATGSTRSHLKTFTLAILFLFVLSAHLIPVVSAHQLPGNLHQPAAGPEGHARGYGHSLGHGLVGRKHGAADKRMMRRVRGKGKDGLEKVIRDEEGPEFGLVKKGSESKRDESQDLAGFAEGLLNAAVAVNVSVGDVTSVTPESTSPIDGFTATEVVTTEPTSVTQEQPTSTVETVSTTSETAATASETVTQTQEPTASSSSSDAPVPLPSESATATASSVSAVAAPSDSAVAPPPDDSAETSTTFQQEAAPTTLAVTSSTAAEVIPDVASTTGTDMAAEAPSSAETTAEAVPTAIVPESSALENVPQSQAPTMSGPIASSVPPTEEPATVDSASELAPTNTAVEVNTQPTLESMQPSVQTVTPETTPTQEGGITSTQAASETIVPPVIAPTTTEETISLPAETSIALATTTSEQPVANPSGSVVEPVPTQTAQVNSQTSVAINQSGTLTVGTSQTGGPLLPNATRAGFTSATESTSLSASTTKLFEQTEAGIGLSDTATSQLVESLTTLSTGMASLTSSVESTTSSLNPTSSPVTTTLTNNVTSTTDLKNNATSTTIPAALTNDATSTTSWTDNIMSTTSLTNSVTSTSVTLMTAMPSDTNSSSIATSDLFTSTRNGTSVNPEHSTATTTGLASSKTIGVVLSQNLTRTVESSGRTGPRPTETLGLVATQNLTSLGGAVTATPAGLVPQPSMRTTLTTEPVGSGATMTSSVINATFLSPTDSFVTESQVASTVTQPADVGPTVTIEPSSSIPSASVSASSVETIAAPVQSATDVANTSETFLATQAQQSAIPTTAQGSVPDAGGSTIVANPSASGTGPDGLATVIPSTTADSANTAGPTGSFDPATTTSTIGPVQNPASTSTLLGAVSSVTVDMTGQPVTSTQGTASGPVPSEVGSSQTSQLFEQTTRVETSTAADPTFGVAPASSANPSTNGSSAIPTGVQATSTVESSSFGPVMTTSIQESVSSGTLPVATSEASFGPVTTSVTSDSQASSSVAITSQGPAESALTTDATSDRLSETAAEPTRTSASSVISPSGNSSMTGEIETSTRPTGIEPNESIATGSATSLVSGTAESTAQSDSWASWESSQSTAAATSSSFQPYVPTATTLIFAAPTSTTSASSSTASATRTQATEQSLTLTPETTLVMPSTAVIASNVPTMIVPPSEPTTTTKAATETATASEDGSQTTAGSALISILLNSNNYPWQFVVNNSDATSQLFVTFPEMLSTALAIDSKEVRTYALQAYSPASYNGDGTELLTKWLGYIPADRVNDLAQYIKTPSSPLYNQAGIPGQLALQIDSSYPLVGSTNTGSNGSPTSAASVSKTDNTRRDTIIGVCVGVGGALWLALAVWIYRRVKRNHDAKIHRRLSERFSVNDGAAFAGTYPANYRHSRSSSLAASEVDDRPSSFYANDADNFPAARRRRSSVSQAVRESVTFGNQSHRPPSGIGSSWFRSSGSQSNRRISRDFGANNPTSPQMSQNPFADIVHRSYLENGPAPRSPAWRTSTNGRPVDKRLIGAPTLQSNSLEFTGYK